MEEFRSRSRFYSDSKHWVQILCPDELNSKIFWPIFLSYLSGLIYLAQNTWLKSLYSDGRSPWVTPLDIKAVFRTPCLFSGSTTRSQMVTTLTTRLSPSCWQPLMLSVNKLDVTVSAYCTLIHIFVDRVYLGFFFFCLPFRYGGICILFVCLWTCYQDSELPLVPAVGRGWCTGTYIVTYWQLSQLDYCAIVFFNVSTCNPRLVSLSVNKIARLCLLHDKQVILESLTQCFLFCFVLPSGSTGHRIRQWPKAVLETRLRTWYK